MRVKTTKDYKLVELRYSNKVLYVMNNGYCYNHDNILLFILTKDALINLSNLLLIGVLSDEEVEDKRNQKYDIKYRNFYGKHHINNIGFYRRIISFIFNERNIKKCDYGISDDIEKINILFERNDYKELLPIYRDIKKLEMLRHYFDHLIM